MNGVNGFQQSAISSHFIHVASTIDTLSQVFPPVFLISGLPGSHEHCAGALSDSHRDRDHPQVEYFPTKVRTGNIRYLEL
jgi:hypothetical protein